jgi:hypothetical protein
MARPSKLTPAVQETIVKAIGLGASYVDAAHAAGVSYDIFNEWMKAGAAAHSGKFFQFFEAIRKEEADAALRHLAVLNNAAAKGEWKASLEWLKRRRRAEWGDSVDFTSGNERIVSFDYSKLIASTAPRPAGDSDAPGKDKGHLHGPALGQNDASGHPGT